MFATSRAKDLPSSLAAHRRVAVRSELRGHRNSPGRRIGLRLGRGVCSISGTTHSSRTLKAVPVSAVELTSMLPPWANTISRAMKRPRPRLVDGRSWRSDLDFAPCTRGLQMI